MGKPIKLVDYLTFGGLTVFGIVVSLIGFLTKQEWNVIKYIIVIVIPLCFIGLAIFILVRKLISQPDYVTTHGVKVWTHKGQFKEKEMELALDYFVENFHRYYNWANLEAYYTSYDICNMLKNMRIECVENMSHIKNLSFYRIVTSGGAQKGKDILLYVGLGIKHSQLFRMLFNVFIEVRLRMPPDKEQTGRIWTEVYKPFINGEQIGVIAGDSIHLPVA